MFNVSACHGSPWPGHACPEELWEAPEGCVRKAGSGEHPETSRGEAKSGKTTRTGLLCPIGSGKRPESLAKSSTSGWKTRRWSTSGAKLPVLRALFYRAWLSRVSQPLSTQGSWRQQRHRDYPLGRLNDSDSLLPLGPEFLLMAAEASSGPRVHTLA